MTRLTSGIIISLFICACFCGCAKRPSSDDKVLATMSNRAVTLSELNGKIAKIPAYYQKIVEKNKKRYLDEFIVENLFYEEAIRQGIDRDKEIQDVLKEAKKKVLIAKYIKNEVEDKIVITEEDMKQFYEANKDKFKTPPMWRASHILVATEKEARDIRGEISGGANFEELARTRSIDATANRGGDVGYFRTGQLVPDFEKACLKLDVGQMSDIVNTQFGYHIIKLTDKKEPSFESYEKAKRVIDGELKRKKRSELFDQLVANLKKKYNVHIKEDAGKYLEAGEKEQPAAK